jgi:predicted nucleic acid-binding protein
VASGQADILVTGDARLRKLGEYQGIKILTPREFLEFRETSAGAEHQTPDES